jgi:hypothetical protein
MARKHSSRHHLRPRDLITHQANQTSKPKIILFFFLSKTFGKTFFGKGGGGANQTSQPKIICFFSWKTFGKRFLEILGIAGPEHGMVWPWQTSALPCNPLACLRISLALSWHGCCSQRHSLRCLFHGSPWHGHCNLCHCLGCPWHALARQPVACHGSLGSPWLALPRQPVACLG